MSIDPFATVDEGQTTADVLRDAGADPGTLLEWMRDSDDGDGDDGDGDDGDGDGGGGDAGELFDRFEEVLYESGTYLESSSSSY